MSGNNDIRKVTFDDTFLTEVKNIVEQGRQQAYASVSQVMIETYWKIGERIVLQEQKGKERADYGRQLNNVFHFCEKRVVKRDFSYVVISAHQ